MLHNGTVTAIGRVWCFRAVCALLLGAAAADAQHFTILGDRTGGAQPGVYEQVWRAAAGGKPEFVVAVGDSIEGLADAKAASEWEEFERIRKPYTQIPFFLAPGNHDIWSDLSERLFERYSGHPRQYSFDRGEAHFTVLDNSRSDALSEAELVFLESDLKAHAARPVKFIISHRPSWIVNAALRNTEFPLHRLARQYGVGYVIAGHVHQMIHLELQGVEYISMPSAGGHLRASGEYREGWFFGYTEVQVAAGKARFEIHELPAPHGQGRVTALADWGMLGLVKK
jgi:hypothetical protein